MMVELTILLEVSVDLEMFEFDSTVVVVSLLVSLTAEFLMVEVVNVDWSSTDTFTVELVNVHRVTADASSMVDEVTVESVTVA